MSMSSTSSPSWLPAMWERLAAGQGSVGTYLVDGEGREGIYLAAGGHVLLLARCGDGRAVEAEIDAERMDLLMEGVDPDTGERLKTMRRGARCGFDQTLTVPRGLMVAAVCWPDVREALDAAMEAGMRRVRDLVASEALARVTVDGRTVRVRADEVLVTSVRHETSRAGDPHWHYHMVVANTVRVGGKWYAVDSDRLFALHDRMGGVWGTTLHADPALREALAAHHLELGADGSLPQLEAEAQVLSTRARQIGARVEELTEAWRQREGLGTDAQPPARVRGMIARQAWAETRRAKTAETTRVDYQAWYGQLLDAGYDPRARMDGLGPLPAPTGAAPRLDDQTAGEAVVARLAARRSAWSRDDVDAAAWALIREMDTVAGPATLDRLHQRILDAALARCERLSDDPLARQSWVRSLTSRQVIECEEELRGRLAARAATPPRRLDPRDTDLLAGLDPGQEQAVRAIIAGDAIIEGAAGSGKTHMLGRVVQWHERHHIGIRLLTPTLQAAQAAAEETGAAATTIAGQLWAHGLRQDPQTGAWRQLRPGEAYVDPRDGATRIWRGVPTGQALPRGGTIVVDEAGLVDAETARALYRLADTAGCHVALVGDRRQLSQIGRGGVLEAAHDWLPETAQVEMLDLHRFRDPAYGRWTLRLRSCPPGQERAIAAEMIQRGMVRVHTTQDDAIDAMAAQWSPRTSLTAATNIEVAAINHAVQSRRIAAGEVDATGPAAPSMVDGETIRAGDVIQTRQNETRAGVANRMRWRVREVRPDGTILAQNVRSLRDVTLTAAYVRRHVQLGYAATAHGAQGLTAERSATLAGDHTSRAALYVGATRGKGDNTVDVVAADQAEAADILAAALRRDSADRGLAAARADLAARIADAEATPAQDGPQTADRPREAPAPTPTPVRPLTARQRRSLAIMDTWLATDRERLARTRDDGAAATAGLDQARAGRARLAQELATTAGTAARARDAWTAAQARHRRTVGAQVASLEAEHARTRAQAVDLYARQAAADRERIHDLRGRIQRLEAWDLVWRGEDAHAAMRHGRPFVTMPRRGLAAEQAWPHDAADTRSHRMGWRRAERTIDRLRQDARTRRTTLSEEELDILDRWEPHPTGTPGQASIEARADRDPEVSRLAHLLDQARQVLADGPLDPDALALRDQATQATQAETVLRDRLARLDQQAATLEERATAGSQAARRLDQADRTATMDDADRLDRLTALYRPAIARTWRETTQGADRAVEERWGRLAAALAADPAAPVWDTPATVDGTAETLGGLVARLAPPADAADGWDAARLADETDRLAARAAADPALTDALAHADGLDDPTSQDIRAQALAGTPADPASYDPTQLAPAIEPPRPRRHHLGL